MGRKEKTRAMSPNRGVSFLILPLASKGISGGAPTRLETLLGSEDVPWEVIVVEGRSGKDAPGSADLSRWGKAPLRVISQPGVEGIRACLSAVREARFDVVSFLDECCRPDPDWLLTIDRVFRAHPEAGACWSKVRPVCEIEPPEGFAAWQENHAHRFAERASEYTTEIRGPLDGVGISFRRQALLDLFDAGFSPRLATFDSGACEEFCLALRMAGWRIWHEEGLVMDRTIPAEPMHPCSPSESARRTGNIIPVLNLYRIILETGSSMPCRCSLVEDSLAVLRKGARILRDLLRGKRRGNDPADRNATQFRVGMGQIVPRNLGILVGRLKRRRLQKHLWKRSGAAQELNLRLQMGEGNRMLRSGAWGKSGVWIGPEENQVVSAMEVKGRRAMLEVPLPYPAGRTGGRLRVEAIREKGGGGPDPLLEVSLQGRSLGTWILDVDGLTIQEAEIPAGLLAGLKKARVMFQVKNHEMASTQGHPVRIAGIRFMGGGEEPETRPACPIPTVSILTPCRNSRKFIATTIESILRQAGRFRIQYLIVDGASDDGTLQICESYRKRVKAGEFDGTCAGIRMDVLSEPDGGMYDALTKGMALVEGEIVAYLNSDDYYQPGAFSSVCEALAQDERLRWVTGIPTVYNSRGRVVLTKTPLCYDRHFIQAGLHDGKILPFIQQESVFFRRSLLDLVDYDAFRRFRYAGDAYLWRAFSQATPLFVLPDLLSGYRSHGENMTIHSEYREEMRQFSIPGSMGEEDLEFLFRLRRAWREMGRRSKISGNRRCLQRDSQTLSWSAEGLRFDPEYRVDLDSHGIRRPLPEELMSLREELTGMGCGAD